MTNRLKILVLGALGVGAFALVHYWPRRPVEIIPCVTSIDNADFNDPKKMEAFVKKAVPLQSDISCMMRVMSSNKFNDPRSGYINELHPSIYGYIYREKTGFRLKYIFSIGYDDRQISFLYKNGKLQRRAVN